MVIILQFQIGSKEKGVEPETLFKVYCPEQYNHFPMKLKMHNNGSVSKNVRYQDLCVERFAINVAFNYEPKVFEVENNYLVDLHEKYGWTHGGWVGVYSYIAEDDEILSMFFLNHNIIVNWNYCNSTWGWFDYETGKWTGAVGKVNIHSVCADMY